MLFRSSESGASETASNSGTDDATESTAPTKEIKGLTRKEARQKRRQTRRDCREEAKARGLHGKEKRKFKRACKAEGGINAEFAGEEADFAFNGYSCFN